MTELNQEDCKKIEALIDFEKYEDCIEICFDLLESINAEDTLNNHSVWYLNLKIAICNRKLSRFKEALRYTHISSNYSGTSEEDYIMTMWMFGNCFYSLGDKKKAIKFYEKCADYFKTNNMIKKYMYMEFNIAKIARNKQKVLESIRLYKENNAPQSSFDNAYETLCNIYIEQNKVHLVPLYIPFIKNKKIAQELNDRISKDFYLAIL